MVETVETLALLEAPSVPPLSIKKSLFGALIHIGIDVARQTPPRANRDWDSHQGGLGSDSFHSRSVGMGSPFARLSIQR